MANLIEEIMESLSPEVSKQLSANMGIRKKDAMQMIPAVAPFRSNFTSLIFIRVPVFCS